MITQLMIIDETVMDETEKMHFAGYEEINVSKFKNMFPNIRVQQKDIVSRIYLPKGVTGKLLVSSNFAMEQIREFDSHLDSQFFMMSEDNSVKLKTIQVLSQIYNIIANYREWVIRSKPQRTDLFAYLEQGFHKLESLLIIMANNPWSTVYGTF